MKLLDKVAVITGGGTGIGRATAILFAKEGADVIICGRRHQPLDDTVSFIKAFGGNCMSIPFDVSKSKEVIDAINQIEKIYGRIDILYNNAADFTSTGKTIIELSEEEWDYSIQINLKGVFLCCKYVIPLMIKTKGGVIVNCSSISGHIGQKKQGTYNVAKGGIELLTKCMALDFAQYNIRVNSVCPGWVEIDQNREEIKNNYEKIIELHPIGRVGQPEDVAKTVLFLACDDSSWITGTSVFVDGGYTAQ
ncbi:MAG: SDR family oxidoreductase [Clostridiales bacterium]|nr:SDR family oxidoreductase [Clostridiales bacterium]